MLNVKQGSCENTNFKVIGLTGLGIKPESTAQETDAPYHSAILAVKFFNVVLFSPMLCFFYVSGLHARFRLDDK